ncbi:AraC family transcriptional regulator [Variovorax sp. RA8]|uniref:AraC family transcriptional regulator n=1 Tax=Variovorax sp. (strain JCM 16519 / RA8) TaxID=662548 RepID=UPI001E5500E3|nr:AraC family transcriptional regulator [Variovorax sp. RA8]
MSNAMAELRRFAMRAENTWTDTGLPRVAVVCAEAFADQVYQPMLHIVLQGSKMLSIGDRMLNCEEGAYFVVPVDVPATGQIRPGGPGLPYLAISLTLDPEVIASLTVGDGTRNEQANTVCFSPVQAPVEMIDAWLRMLRLGDRPHEIAALAPMVEREILFRALQGPLGDQLREIARPDGRLAQIRRAVQWIRDHYAEPFLVESLASIADMSVPSFYRHFRAVTSMTPIQYQKRLRLLRARWLLLFEPRDAASVAFTVGYESPSQFTREYARMFGLPPIRDIARFKAPAMPNDGDAAGLSLQAA